MMFQSALILGVSIVYVVQHPLDTSYEPPPEENPTTAEIDDANLMDKARWCLGISFSIVVICLSAIALLSRSLDKPGTLKITNRYLRLLPRLLLIVVAICLPLKQTMKAIDNLGIVVGCVVVILYWEWYASLDKTGGLFEP